MMSKARRKVCNGKQIAKQTFVFIQVMGGYEGECGRMRPNSLQPHYIHPIALQLTKRQPFTFLSLLVFLQYSLLCGVCFGYQKERGRGIPDCEFVLASFRRNSACLASTCGILQNHVSFIHSVSSNNAFMLPINTLPQIFYIPRVTKSKDEEMEYERFSILFGYTYASRFYG